jgi:hypothetical protein
MARRMAVGSRETADLAREAEAIEDQIAPGVMRARMGKREVTVTHITVKWANHCGATASLKLRHFSGESNPNEPEPPFQTPQITLNHLMKDTMPAQSAGGCWQLGY